MTPCMREMRIHNLGSELNYCIFGANMTARASLGRLWLSIKTLPCEWTAKK